MQGVEGVKLPVLSVVRVTVPIGAVGVVEVSVTVTVHVVAMSLSMGLGAQVIVVEVGVSALAFGSKNESASRIEKRDRTSRGFIFKPSAS